MVLSATPDLPFKGKVEYVLRHPDVANVLNEKERAGLREVARHRERQRTTDNGREYDTPMPTTGSGVPPKA